MSAKGRDFSDFSAKKIGEYEKNLLFLQRNRK